MRIVGIDIADFDVKFIIEQPTYELDSLTNEKKKASWSTFATVWGKIDEVTNDKIEADQQVALGDSMVTTRWVSGVTENMRLNSGGTYHYIKGMKTTDRNVTIQFKTEKRDNI
jgi:head-tail adaptor